MLLLMYMKSAKSNPKVSIVIPVYNGENYIAQAIRSALAQDYSDLEILVIDDGSTDKTADICKSFNDDRIRYIHKANGGVSSALNLGIQEMKGEYFSWLSHDDLYEPNKVSEEVNFLKGSNLLHSKTIVFSDYELIDEAGFHITSVRIDSSNVEKKQEYVILEGKIDGLSLLIPKTAFNECGLFSTNLTAIQDYDLWWRFLKKYTFVHLDKILVSTRCHSKQVTNTSPKVLSEGNRFFTEAIDSITEKRMSELEGSAFSFYSEMNRYFSNTIHTEVADHCVKKMQEITSKCASIPEITVALINEDNNASGCLETLFSQDYRGKINIIVPSSITDVPLVPKAKKKQFSINRAINTRSQKDYISSILTADNDNPILLLNPNDKLTKTAIKHLSAAFCVSSAAIVSGLKQDNPKVIYSGNCQKEILSNNPSTSLFLISKGFLSSMVNSNPSIIFDKNGNLIIQSLLLEATSSNHISSCNSIVASTRSKLLSSSKRLASIENTLVSALSLQNSLFLTAEITTLLQEYDRLLHEEQPSPKIALSKPQKALYFLRKEGIGGVSKRFCKKLLSITRH